MLIERARLPELHAGDLLAVPATGAYAASMASNYNLLPRPAAVMVDDGVPRSWSSAARRSRTCSAARSEPSGV